LIILAFSLVSCGPVVGEQWLLNDEGAMVCVQKLTLDRSGKVEAETPDGFKMKIDTRKDNLWRENVVPMVAGGLNRTEAVVK